MRFAEIIVPLPVYGTFTYFIPEEMREDVAVGSRVLVQFGKRKHYTGIVAALHDTPPKGYETKPILSVLDPEPIVRYPQLNFWKWISGYYLCSIGEVFKSAVPSGLKVESETFVCLNPDFQCDEADFTEAQAQVFQIIENEKRIRISDIEKRSGFRNTTAIINRLLEAGAVEINERQTERYRPRCETVVRLRAERFDMDAIHYFFARTSHSEKQQSLLMAYLQLSGWNNRASTLRDVTKKEIAEKCDASSAVMRAMEEKNIFRYDKITVNRFKDSISDTASGLTPLSAAQQTALDSINASFAGHNVSLLHGVTGSGKTEIYAHLIQKALDAGNQVLYLVPEISLTTQLTDRLRKLLGKRLLVYHSKFSDNERVDIWRRLLTSREPLIVLGVRSSVFLPFSRIGLVIVDEEHEPSFKQYDPAPRYNARDAAIMLATMHGAKVLLGSATPSVETYFKAKSGKYGLVTLSERFGDGKLPEVEVIDMPAQRKKKKFRGILSEPLFSSVGKTLKEGNQSIIFQNRRGFAPVVICKECGWSPKCVNCDVSLIYHKSSHLLRCHYCGYSIPLPDLCPACGLNGIETHGYGTERIAEELHEALPEAHIARMDLDTTRNKENMQRIIEDFSEGKTNLLVGTQMVSKGLDFRKVRIVGVVNADTLLNFPDFKSDERAFNMLEQVAGRAGRHDNSGKVMIQTTRPDTDLFRFVENHDYTSYYESQIADRRKYDYPPFTKIINLYLKHKDSRILDDMAIAYASELRKIFAGRVLGPEKPFVSRIATLYLQCIMLKIEADASMKKVKDILHNLNARMASDPRMKGIIIYYDVDPA